MTAIRHELQKELFAPCDQRLLSLVNVSEPKKKKKTYFLCLVVTTQHPLVLSVAQVKSKNEGGYAIKSIWSLKEVSQVDGIHPRKAMSEFQFTSATDGRVYKWFATSVAEKEPFIKSMHKACLRYMPLQKPDFVNVPIPVEQLEMQAELAAGGATAVSLTDSDSTGRPANQRVFMGRGFAVAPTFLEIDLSDLALFFHAHRGGKLGEGGAAGTGLDAYTTLSDREQADLRDLIAQCDGSLGRIDQFTAGLTRELTQLDSKNMNAIMGSEAAVAELMNVIDGALGQCDSIDSQLAEMDGFLALVRDSVELMESRDSVNTVQTESTRTLTEQLDAFMSALDFNDEHEKCLMQSSLSEPRQITQCTRAAQQLRKCLEAKIAPGLERMECYANRMKRLNSLASDFAEKLVAHLTTLFQNLSELRSEGGVGEWHALSLPKHSQRHHALMPFADLILWLKQTRQPHYRALIKRYGDYTSEMYERDFVAFFDVLHNELSQQFAPGKGPPATGTLDRKNKGGGEPSAACDTSLATQRDFCKLCETLLSEVDPVVVAEQKFCVRFFHISAETLLAATRANSAAAETASTCSGDSDERKLERQFNEMVRALMATLFRHLDAKMRTYVEYCCELNPSLAIPLLVLLSSKVLSLQDNGSYFGFLLGTTVLTAKHKFDNFVRLEESRLSTYRPTKQKRIGILDSVLRFQTLCESCEWIVKSGAAPQSLQHKSPLGENRRSDLDRSLYPRLLAAVLRSIEAAGSEGAGGKTPKQLVRFENYHYLHSALSSLKIACLDAERRKIKQNYTDAVQAYVLDHMGKPLERLHAFMEGAEKCIAQGMDAKEVGYQQQFNKQELKKIVASYPGSEVRKGLVALYKQLEKHLGSDSNEMLLQVVWRNMQDEFLRQLKRYDSLIQQLYPGSRVELAFTIDDVLSYFSEIAQQR